MGDPIKMRKILILMIALLFLLTGCVREPAIPTGTAGVSPESITLENTETDIHCIINGIIVVNLSISPIHFDENQLTCVVSDPDVIKVIGESRTQTGYSYVLTGISAGTASVSVESKNGAKSEELAIEVEPDPETTVDLLNFGDSISAGENNDGEGYAHLIAQRRGMSLKSYAKSGATVAPNSEDRASCILYQLQDAPETAADYVLLEGGYNDCYHQDTIPTGKITEGTTDSLDPSTFCGALETLLKTAKEKYKTAKIIYVIAHKAPARDGVWEPYTELIQQACEKWEIEYVDMYHDSEFDCYDDDIRNEYADQYGSHPNEAGYLKYYVPMLEKLIS